MTVAYLISLSHHYSSTKPRLEHCLYTNIESDSCKFANNLGFSKTARCAKVKLYVDCDVLPFNPFNASCFKLLLFKGFSAMLV